MVTGRVMVLTGKTFVLLNPISGVSDNRIYSLLILIC